MGTLTGLTCDVLRCVVSGGGKRDRTADLLHAMQALSQLSYTPSYCYCLLLHSLIPGEPERARILCSTLGGVKKKAGGKRGVTAAIADIPFPGFSAACRRFRPR